MRLSPPLAGPLVITQPFAANPQVYAKFGLPGHEGTDYRAKEGTPVMAVDDGTVALVGTTGNYGLNYRIVHPWGESVYAHLSKQLVAMGQRVSRGQVIGLSGSTGNSDGPHLHFGLRVAPFFRDSKRDKWQGFCNPAPYFQPERFLMGPHIHNGNGSMIPLLRQWQPAAVTLLDPAKDFVAELASACPDTKIVGRIYRPDSEVSDRIKANPGAAAQWMHELVTGHPAYGAGRVQEPGQPQRAAPTTMYWQIANEVCQGQWDDFVKLDQCMWHWMDLAAGAYHCGLFAFSVGNPDAPANDPNWWNKITPTLQRATREGHVLLIHEYGTGDGLDGPKEKGGADWLVQRYVRQVRPWLQVRDVQIIVSEFGYDGLLIGPGPAGWRTSGKTAQTYAGELIAMADNYARYRDQIVGVTVYTMGALDEWHSYNIDGEVAGMLAARAEAVRAGGTVVTPPVVVDDPADAGWIAAAKQQRLQLNPGAALQKVMVKDGFAPVTSEFTFAQNGISYIGQVAERVDRADKARLFYCEVGKWNDVRQEVEP